MKRSLSLVGIVSIGGFAMDQYIPVPAKSLQVDVSYSHITPTGGYDQGNGKQKFGPGLSSSFEDPSLQVKLGILPGFDLEVQSDYIVGSDASGLARPTIGIKYAHPKIGAGAFLDVSLPVGGEEIVGSGPTTSFFAGALYDKVFGKFGVNAVAGYQYSLPVTDIKQDEIHVLAQGQYDVDDHFSPYLAIAFSQALQAYNGGTGIKNSDGNSLTLTPGVNFKVSDKWTAEFGLPLAVMVNNALSESGFFGALKYRVGL